jgi:hypothetical protein
MSARKQVRCYQSRFGLHFSLEGHEIPSPFKPVVSKITSAVVGNVSLTEVANNAYEWADWSWLTMHFYLTGSAVFQCMEYHITMKGRPFIFSFQSVNHVITANMSCPPLINTHIVRNYFMIIRLFFTYPNYSIALFRLCT